ncbi:ESCRT-II complex, vps25 subunit [Trichocladium antarcticum]|uniref:ESCRT-II complex subunit VPS25 n=1 Tax=Trichocladium antarcticum TaxID=1450529 RepID=A0AAN6UKU3_9PEZI|nr:ESCRT-II complex, vps25 subunit [Trichocladium antarcticum]
MTSPSPPPPSSNPPHHPAATATATATATSPTPPPPTPPSDTFPFPREYAFPPFFTLQTNLTTQHAQLSKWAALVLAYCRHHRIVKLALSSTATTTTTTTTTPTPTTDSSTTDTTDTTALFHNRALGRRLALCDIRRVVDFLRRDGRAEYISRADQEGGDVVWVYWRTPEEWAGLVEGWVEGTGQKGSVLTVYELVEGDGTRGTEFHGLDQELLLKALGVLVKRGKAQVFGQEGSQGVKFF